MGETKRRTGPKPLCQCGCGERVKGWHQTYATPQCVPFAIRSAAAKKARRLFAYRRRAIFFREQIERLFSGGPQITREDIATVFDAVYDRGWTNGYHACDFKHAQRRKRAA